MKNQKGITLVALIITIIVMVILAGVIIVSAVADGGIIDRAQGAMKENERAEAEELVLASYVYKTTASTTTVGTLDLNATADAIYENLTTNGFTLMDGNTQAGAGSDVLEGDKINLNIVGKHGNYSGTVTEKGLEGNLKSNDAPKDLTPLEKYVLGENGTGRNLTEIANMDNEPVTFIPEESTIPDADTSIILTSVTDEDENGYAYAYIKYNSNGYKIKVDFKNFQTISIISTFVQEDGSYLGKYVQYDGKLWVVLYDDDTNGLQMITAETLEANNVYLGYDDTQIDWEDATVISQANIFDTDNPSETQLLSNTEKAIYSYNNAIVTLNNKCASLISDKSAIETNSDGNYKIRSVGSNPINPNSENSTLYTSDNLKNRPTNNSTYSVGMFDKIAKSTDTNYTSDYDNIMNLGINNTGEDYWLASRLAREDIWIGEEFRILAINGRGDLWKSDGDAWALLFSVRKMEPSGFSWEAGVRPVITLKENVLENVTGTGTQSDPYVIK